MRISIFYLFFFFLFYSCNKEENNKKTTINYKSQTTQDSQTSKIESRLRGDSLDSIVAVRQIKRYNLQQLSDGVGHYYLGESCDLRYFPSSLMGKYSSAFGSFHGSFHLFPHPDKEGSYLGIFIVYDKFLKGAKVYEGLVEKDTLYTDVQHSTPFWNQMVPGDSLQIFRLMTQKGYFLFYFERTTYVDCTNTPQIVDLLFINGEPHKNPYKSGERKYFKYFHTFSRRWEKDFFYNMMHRKNSQ